MVVTQTLSESTKREVGKQNYALTAFIASKHPPNSTPSCKLMRVDIIK